jgi:hypothetical protein
VAHLHYNVPLVFELKNDIIKLYKRIQKIKHSFQYHVIVRHCLYFNDYLKHYKKLVLVNWKQKFVTKADAIGSAFKEWL